MLTREEKKQRAAAENERRVAEEQSRTAEAREREISARSKEKMMRRQARMDEADLRAEEAERKLENRARARHLREIRAAEKDENRRSRAAYRETHPGFYDPNLKLHSVIAVLLSLGAVFIILSFLLRGEVGAAGNAVANALLGCFSYAAYLIPVFMLVHAALWRADVRNRALLPKAIAFLPVLLISATLAAVYSPLSAGISAGEAYLAGIRYTGGGSVGAFLADKLTHSIGTAGVLLLAALIYLFFLALYFRNLIRALYVRAHRGIRERMIARAKARDEERERRRAEKEDARRMREEDRLAAKEEKEAARRRAREERENDRLRAREEWEGRHARLTEREPGDRIPRQTDERLAARTSGTVARVSEPLPPEKTPAPAGTQAAFPTRRRGDSPADRVHLQTPTAKRETSSPTERRRSLFRDLEEDPTAPAENTTGRDAARRLFDFNHMPPPSSADEYGRMFETPARREAAAKDSRNRHATTDIMRNVEGDYSALTLPISNESLDPVRVAMTGVIPTPQNEEKKSEAEPKKSALGNSPLGRLMRRQAAAPPMDDTPEGRGMSYFRKIAVNAGEQARPDGDRPFVHPDINPAPRRVTAIPSHPQNTREIPPDPPMEEVDSFLEDDDDVSSAEDVRRDEPTMPPLADGTPRNDNPFHPQNNARFRSAAPERPASFSYTGVHDPRAFAPPADMPRPNPQPQVAQRPATPEGNMRPIVPAPKKEKAPYRFPPISLLLPPDPVDESNIASEVQATAERLVSLLDNFKVRTQITGYSRGPRITRYEVVPDAGVRVRSITALIDDICMSLKTDGVRIESPIPGKSAVGVEVPNEAPSLVRLRQMLDTPAFRDAPEKTMVCLGSDVAGKPVYCDLAKMPHLLVAGATGMGKSVCINSIIASLLYKATPDDVRMIMIDPKKVEFSMYAGIPHLLVPVVTDPKKAAGALSWAVSEMERRYGLIDQAGVRNIKGYNAYVAETGNGERLPKIIIIIDELHDLMMSAKDTVETSIARIAAKARAAGIHLLIGTQRPSVDVITGTIKANIPSRIAFHVSSQVDSRTILDYAGAEKLLINGDMLFASVGTPKPQRVQGAFVDDKEIERVVTYLKENNEVDEEAGEEIMADIEREAEKCDPQKNSSAAEEGGANAPRDEDDHHLQWSALEVGFNYGKLSTSLLQRKLSIGYGKAAKILDALYEQGYISAQDGAKPRELRITQEEFRELKLRAVEESGGSTLNH